MMSLLVEIHEVTIYKFPKNENIVSNTLAKLAKELACLIDESLSIMVQNYHILAPISLDFIKSRTLEGEFTILEIDLIID